MALDFGLRQIGVAVGNLALGTSQPLPIVKARDGRPEWRALEAVISAWDPDLVVVGDPINMDGSRSPMSARAKKFAQQVRGRLGVKVVLVDERLTSFEAKAISREEGHRGDYRKRPVDSRAAQLILKTWLAENNKGSD